MRSQACAVNKIWEKARDQLRETLGKATFKSLLESQSCMSSALPACAKAKAARRAMKMKKKVSPSKKGG
jgi:DNA-binding IscR family transcriptional regulator